MSEPLYKILEEGTNGWYLLDDYENLNREKCKEIYGNLIAKGYNPNRLKIVRTI